MGTSSSSQLDLSYNGDNPPESISVDVTVSWLDVSTEQVDNDGLGTYLLAVDRTGLDDGLYSTVLTFIADTGDEVSVTVTMQVGDSNAPDELPPVYVLLIDNNTGEVIAEGRSDNATGNFVIGNVPMGTYRVQAGSDIDVDLYICQSAEVCGEYPDLIDVGEEGLSGVEVTMELVPTTGTSPLSAKAVKK